MELKRGLPLSFFEKPRPIAPKNSLADIIPIKWTKETIDGKKEVIVSLPKESRER